MKSRRSCEPGLSLPWAQARKAERRSFSTLICIVTLSFAISITLFVSTELVYGTENVIANILLLMDPVAPLAEVENDLD